MKKNPLAPAGKTKKFRDVADILRDPVKAAKLQSYIDETVIVQGKILDHKLSIKGLRESAVEEVEIEPKMFNALTALFFNNNFDQKKAEIEKLEAAIDALMSPQQLARSNDASDPS